MPPSPFPEAAPESAMDVVSTGTPGESAMDAVPTGTPGEIPGPHLNARGRRGQGRGTQATAGGHATCESLSSSRKGKY